MSLIITSDKVYQPKILSDAAPPQVELSNLPLELPYSFLIGADFLVTLGEHSDENVQQHQIADDHKHEE